MTERSLIRVWLGCALALTLVVASCSVSEGVGSFVSWFATPDQQAQRHFDEGSFQRAAELFTDPLWRGTALFRAGEFEKAAGVFGRIDTAEGFFNRGNALVLLGRYRAAIGSFEQALEMKPHWRAAAENLAIARARLERLTPEEDGPPEKGVGRDDEPDQIVFDDRAKNRSDAETQTVAGQGEELNDKALRALWLRRLETSPADFLQRKFAYQHAREERLSEVEDNR